jgi:hypothetical protein
MDGLKRQEEQMLKQEKMRRETLEYEAQLKQKAEIARVKAEAEGKIKQERENHDLILQKLKMEAGEKREAMVQSVKDATSQVLEGLSNYVNDKEKLQNTALTASAIALGLYTAKVGTGVAGRFIEANLGKPSLVRDTSRVRASETNPATEKTIETNSLLAGHREPARAEPLPEHQEARGEQRRHQGARGRRARGQARVAAREDRRRDGQHQQDPRALPASHAARVSRGGGRQPWRLTYIAI